MPTNQDYLLLKSHLIDFVTQSPIELLRDLVRLSFHDLINTVPFRQVGASPPLSLVGTVSEPSTGGASRLHRQAPSPPLPGEPRPARGGPGSAGRPLLLFRAHQRLTLVSQSYVVQKFPSTPFSMGDVISLAGLSALQKMRLPPFPNSLLRKGISGDSLPVYGPHSLEIRPKAVPRAQRDTGGHQRHHQQPRHL